MKSAPFHIWEGRGAVIASRLPAPELSTTQKDDFLVSQVRVVGNLVVLGVHYY